MGVLIKNGINYTGATGIIDSVGSTSSALALSANQGNKLASNMGAIELTDSASRAYATNDYFVWKSQFVRATKAISAGDTILLSGTNANVESTNIGSVLTELNSRLVFTYTYDIRATSDHVVFNGIIYKYGNMAFLRSTFGQVPTNTNSVIWATIPSSFTSAEIVTFPVIGVPSGSATYYILSAFIYGTNIYISNMSGGFAQEAYLCVWYPLL